jgi:serine/threonine/tyrosine protein kinase RAD53
MCGTPSYLAPEVVTQQNSSGYDSLVDSWSVGVILFSMLTNTTPFIESSIEDLRTRIASRDIDWGQLGALYGLSDEGNEFTFTTILPLTHLISLGSQRLHPPPPRVRPTAAHEAQ